MLKILQVMLQQYVNRELPDVQGGFRKGRGTEIKLPTYIGSWKKQESPRKTSISALLTMPKPLTVWITINGGTFFKRWEYFSFSPLLFPSLLFTAICKASPDRLFAFLHFFSMGMVLIPVSCIVSPKKASGDAKIPVELF